MVRWLGVYAAGDVTTLPLKHGGLATQQADTIAHSIAAPLGVDTEPPAAERVLHLRLVGGRDPLIMRITLDDHSRPVATELGRPPSTPEPRAGKVHGRYLTPYLARRPELAA